MFKPVKTLDPAHVAALVQGISAGVYATDRDGRCTFINGNGAKLLGYEPAEILGQHVHDLFHHTRGDASAYPVEECPLEGACRAGEPLRTDDEVFWRKDGDQLPVEVIQSPLPASAGPGSLVIFLEITRRKRALRRLSIQHAVSSVLAEAPSFAAAAPRLLQDIGDALDWQVGAVWLVDRAATALRCAATWHAESIPAGEFEAATRGRTFAQGEGWPGRVWSSGQPTWSMDVAKEPNFPRAPQAAKEGLHAAVCFPIRFGGNFIGAMEFFGATMEVPDKDLLRTMTTLGYQIGLFIEREWGKEQLVRAKEEAEAANLAKSQFLANMSHELRTPLNAVIMYSELLQEEAEDRGVTEFIPDLEKIRGGGKHLLALVNGVLDLSKIEAGKMELFLETFDIRNIIDEAAATVEPLVQKRANRLVIDCPESLGTMHADLTKVRQILFNLVSNACKFTEQGAITLEAERETQEGQEWIVFRVSDTGIGMTDDQLKGLFKPFSQGDASTTRKYGGTGLGLAITKRFSEMMGGDASAASALHKGSVFVVRLPAQVALAKKDAAETTAASAHAGNTVLVIDDDPAAQEFVRRVLAPQGIQVITAANGPEGLRLAAKAAPAVIFLDVIMPGTDGWSVLQALKAEPTLASIPVVMLTILDEQEMGYVLGAAEYLAKPIERESLLRVVQKYHVGAEANHLLIVEDDDSTRHVVRRIMVKQGWTVAEAGNGRQALEQVARQVPQLILLDLMMPEMDGFEFLGKLRKNDTWQSIPVVVLTAKDLTTQDREMLAGNVEKVLQKGALTRFELAQLIKKVVALHAKT